MDIDEDIFRRIEERFHGLIRLRVGRLVDEHRVELPVLDPVAMEDRHIRVPVPGMFGGFACWFEPDKDVPTPVSETWMRVVGGSGLRHLITANGRVLVEEGFVLPPPAGSPAIPWSV